MTDFVPSPGMAGPLPADGGALPFAPAPPATTINDAAGDPGLGVLGGPIAAAPVIPAGIPAPPRAVPRRNNAAMAVGIGGIVVAMLGVIAFVLIRQDRKADDEEAEVATIALPPEPAPVASAPGEPPPAEDPGLAEPPPEPAVTAPPPATAPPKTTAPPKSTAPPKPPPSSTTPPPGNTRPPSSDRPKIKVIPRPGSRPPSDKPGSSTSSGGGTSKRPKLVVKPR